MSAPASLHWPQPNSRAEDSLTVFTHALTPSLGFLPTIENQSPDELAGRWRIEPGTNQTVFEDPVTGLRVVRCWKELPGSGFVCLEMMVSNGGTVPLRLTDLRSAEWIFDIADDLKSACYQPLDFRNDTWYGSSYWTGPDWTRVGKDWHHPGENTASIRCFTAPQDGRVSITGRIYKADTNGGDGVAPAIRHGNRTVWEAVIGPRDSVGIEPQVSFRVHQGETIRFVVSKRGQIACDTTHWNPLITYDNGRRFLASEGFSGTATGGIWSYEMELASPILTNWPNIHFLGADLLARAQTIRPGIPVAIDNHSALPLLVLAGCANHSGLLLAPATERDWHLDASLSDSGKLRLTVCEGGTRKSLVLAPGESVPLVSLLCGVYNGSWEQGAGIWRHTIQVQGRNAEVALLGRLVAAACERESARLEAASVRLRLSHANLFVPPARLVCRFPPSKSELNRPAIESRTRCYFGGSWSVPELAAASRSVNQEQINTVAGL
ncbi:MAG: hypothetical protein M1608_00225, partial [Candidatus Omnitrophica bacterium]|nr:hypothetical protein [Candidatus Omnitrophota bacterium]